MRLAGKVAIVTGAASGFGAAIARRFAEEGAAIVLADINGAGASDLASALRAAGGIAEWVKCDVAREADFRGAVRRALEAFRGFHILVNNAGATHRSGPALTISEADVDRMVDVNMKSIYWSVQCAFPYFVEHGKGVVVNVASATSARPAPGLTWYSATKAAMVNLTKGLAQEFAKDGVRVNVINPMLGETAMLEDFMGMTDTPENRQRFLSRIPLGRLTRPADVANAALFLASDEAEFITGASLDVDGGRNI